MLTFLKHVDIIYPRKVSKQILWLHATADEYFSNLHIDASTTVEDSPGRVLFETETVYNHCGISQEKTFTSLFRIIENKIWGKWTGIVVGWRFSNWERPTLFLLRRSARMLLRFRFWVLLETIKILCGIQNHVNWTIAQNHFLVSCAVF